MDDQVYRAIPALAASCSEPEISGKDQDLLLVPSSRTLSRGYLRSKAMWDPGPHSTNGGGAEEKIVPYH